MLTIVIAPADPFRTPATLIKFGTPQSTTVVAMALVTSLSSSTGQLAPASAQITWTVLMGNSGTTWIAGASALTTSLHAPQMSFGTRKSASVSANHNSAIADLI
jgi:hypothetical protein